MAPQTKTIIGKTTSLNHRILHLKCIKIKLLTASVLVDIRVHARKSYYLLYLNSTFLIHLLALILAQLR